LSCPAITRLAITTILAANSPRLVDTVSRLAVPQRPTLTSPFITTPPAAPGRLSGHVLVTSRLPGPTCRVNSFLCGSCPAQARMTRHVLTDLAISMRLALLWSCPARSGRSRPTRLALPSPPSSLTTSRPHSKQAVTTTPAASCRVRSSHAGAGRAKTTSLLLDNSRQVRPTSHAVSRTGLAPSRRQVGPRLSHAITQRRATSFLARSVRLFISSRVSP
jgi:hypothetical protein